MKHVLALSGTGVGGGSLVWAKVCYEPHRAALEDPQWGHITDWGDELATHFEQARRMLWVHQTPSMSNSDRVLEHAARHFGWRTPPSRSRWRLISATRGWRNPTRISGARGRPGRAVSSAAGVWSAAGTTPRTPSTSTTFLAERNGAIIHPEHQAVDVVPRPGGGYRVDTERPGA